MENMDMELTVPKWVPIVRLKIPQMPQNILAQNACPSPKVQDFLKNLSLWVSPVRNNYELSTLTLTRLLGNKPKGIFIIHVTFSLSHF